MNQPQWRTADSSAHLPFGVMWLFPRVPGRRAGPGEPTLYTPTSPHKAFPVQLQCPLHAIRSPASSLLAIRRSGLRRVVRWLGWSKSCYLDGIYSPEERLSLLVSPSSSHWNIHVWRSLSIPARLDGYCALQQTDSVHHPPLLGLRRFIGRRSP